MQFALSQRKLNQISAEMQRFEKKIRKIKGRYGQFRKEKKKIEN
jgi:prefoldin subunit 5